MRLPHYPISPKPPKSRKRIIVKFEIDVSVDDAHDQGSAVDIEVGRINDAIADAFERIASDMREDEGD